MRLLLWLTFICFAVAFCLVNYFGMIAFLSLSMWVFFMVMALLVSVPIIYVAVRLVRPGTRSRQSALHILLIPLATILILPLVGPLHRFGTKMKFQANETELVVACNAMLNDIPANEFVWPDAFNLWPSLIGPTRKAAYHADGIVYISFSGSPGVEAGLAYHSETASDGDPNKHCFGRWYWFRHGED